MTIDQFHNAIREYANPGQNRYFSPEEIDTAIQNSIDDFYRQEYKHFEETQEITDTLGFFKSFYQKSLSGGNIDLPSDFNHVTDVEVVMSDASKRAADEVRDGEWSELKNSVAFSPTSDYPKYRQFARKIEVLPVTGTVHATSVNLYYLRKPVVVKFNYTTVGYTFVFNLSGSVNPDWPDIDHTRIMMKALGYLGLPVDNRTMIQSEQIKKVTNENA